jgi:hypothetical protein
LLICFSRDSSSLWSHLHRLWPCSCSNKSSLWLNYFTNWCLTSYDSWHVVWTCNN